MSTCSWLLAPQRALVIHSEGVKISALHQWLLPCSLFCSHHLAPLLLLASGEWGLCPPSLFQTRAGPAFYGPGCPEPASWLSFHWRGRDSVAPTPPPFRGSPARAAVCVCVWQWLSYRDLCHLARPFILLNLLFPGLWHRSQELGTPEWHILLYLESPSPTLGRGPWARLVHGDPSPRMDIFPVVSWVPGANKLLKSPERVILGLHHMFWSPISTSSALHGSCLTDPPDMPRHV